MKQQFLTLIFLVLLTSCVSTKKYSKYVESSLVEHIELKGNENIQFDFSGLESHKSLVHINKEKSQFIPAVIYWEWNDEYSCQISQNYIGQYLQTRFMHYVDSLKIDEKLDGRKLEIKFEKVPNSFVYTHKGHFVFLLFAYMIRDLEAIYPNDENLLVSYKLFNDKTELDKGDFLIKNKNQAVKNFFKSTKRFTRLYVRQFNLNVDLMAMDMAVMMMNDL